jgi:hypothetical protein
VAMYRAIRERSWMARLTNTWMLASVLGTVVSVAAWARPAGWANNLMTTCVFCVVPAFVEMHRFTRQVTNRGRLFLFTTLGLQLLWLRYNPAHHIPTRADYAAGEKFVDEIRPITGPVLVLQRPWLAILAGKGPSYHANAFWEISFLAQGDLLPQNLQRRFEEGFYTAIALDDDPRRTVVARGMIPDEMSRSYVCDQVLVLPGRGLDPFEGAFLPEPRTLCRWNRARK